MLWFAEYVKKPSKAGMMGTINWDTFYLFKNTWIGDFDALCHITNDDTYLLNIIDIDKLIQGSSNIIPAIKMGKQ